MIVHYIYKKSNKQVFKFYCSQSDVPLEGDLVTAILLTDEGKAYEELRWRVKERHWFPKEKNSSVTLKVIPV